MTAVTDKIERLQSADFEIWWLTPADAAEARESGRVSWHYSYQHETEGDVAYVTLGRVAAGDDIANQTSTVERSNYRSLKRDLDTVPWIDTAYANVDHLGALVADLHEDAVDLLVELVEQYSVYNEDDLTELEQEEITESVRDWVAWDLGRTFEDEGVAERWSDLEEDTQADLIFTAVSEYDLYPEHNGLEVIWDLDRLAKFIAPKL